VNLDLIKDWVHAATGFKIADPRNTEKNLAASFNAPSVSLRSNRSVR